MSDQYLWDRSGPPDPEIERLEQVLAPLRYGKPLPVRKPPVLRWAAAAAVVAAALALSQFALPTSRTRLRDAYLVVK